jgi:ABC-type polysaccharide transport system permease subunit
MFDFTLLGKIDISNLKQKLLNLDESAWHEDSSRQNKHQVHSNTHFIPIMWDVETSSQMIWGQKTKYYYNFDFEKLFAEITDKINQSLGNNGVIFRSILARLGPNETISAHIDRADMMRYCKKIHIPIITNDNVLFQVGVTEKNLKEGEIWDVNVTNLHAVYNQSNENRVHLITMYTDRKDLLKNCLDY